MVMVFPGPTDRTTEIIARDVFLDALNDPELTFQIHTQRPRDLDSAVEIAQYLEAVMRSLPSRSSKPVRTVVQGGDEDKLAAELEDLCDGQGHWLDTLEQFGNRLEGRSNKSSRSQTLGHRRPCQQIGLIDEHWRVTEKTDSAQYGVFLVRIRGPLRQKLRSG